MRLCADDLLGLLYYDIRVL
ncbi:hypothetical protein Egran_03118 [Elaphomyces granulatus]|uniref:Uncharacterized protein n=1 Tax=Elaphomyces granulatus TaxID=519963 RepID=A0A232LYA2_9EURO|nr:hypothetical protein Egran_03118 [Elaphomyces granulatus]